MTENEELLNPDEPEDRALIDSLLAIKHSQEEKSRELCPWHPEQEALIWAYADSSLDDAESEAALQAIGECRACLERLITVQEDLQAAELWLVTTPIVRSFGRLSLFDTAQIGVTINRVGQVLATALFKPVPVAGPATKPWTGKLSHFWDRGEIDLTIEVYLDPNDHPERIRVQADVNDQNKQPLSETQIDFCDIDGLVLETGITDETGRVTFSSHEGDYFIKEARETFEIGFCLQLPEMQKWLIMVDTRSED